MNRPMDPAVAEGASAAALRSASRQSLKGRSLWDADRARIAWADPDGIKAWGADSLGDLLDARFVQTDPLPRMLVALRDRLTEGESVIEELRLGSPQGAALSGLCRIMGQRLADGRLGLMIDLLDTPPRNETSSVSTPPPPPPPVRHEAGPRVQTLINAIGEAVVVFDGTGTMTALNGAAGNLLGADTGPLEGRMLAEWLDEQAARGLAAYLADAPAMGRIQVLADGKDIPLVDETGLVRRPVTISLGTIMPEEPGVLGSMGARHVALFRDLSGQRAREQALEAAREDADLRSRRKSEVLARVSHGLRTPLTAVLGFSEVLMKSESGAAAGEKTRAYARHIFEAGQHALSLVEDLLELSRIEAGRLPLHFETIDLPPVVETCLAMVQPLAAQGGIKIDARLQRTLDPVDMDLRSLRQILVSLLSLAIRRSPAGGTVTLTVQRSEQAQIGIAVQDQGAPFGSETLGALRRLSLGDGSLFAGNAPLDLPLAKALTEANNGAFCVESDGQHGTLIQIMVPVAADTQPFL